MGGGQHVTNCGGAQPPGEGSSTATSVSKLRPRAAAKDHLVHNRPDLRGHQPNPAHGHGAAASEGVMAVTERLTLAVGRRAARAILIDDRGRLVLIKRTKPGQPPYWTAPGGGVEDADGPVEAALHRGAGRGTGGRGVGGVAGVLVQLSVGFGRSGAAFLRGPPGGDGRGSARRP